MAKSPCLSTWSPEASRNVHACTFVRMRASENREEMWTSLVVPRRLDGGAGRTSWNLQAVVLRDTQRERERIPANNLRDVRTLHRYACLSYY